MGKFVIEKGPGGHYFFKLISSTGESIFTSEKYFFKAGCKHAIEKMRANASNFLKYELVTTYDGKYFFRLKGSKDQSIGESCFCETAEKRNFYVETVKNSSPYAGLIDLTQNNQLNPV
jgi:uncharacterized protein YegP (UPF0339 family)